MFQAAIAAISGLTPTMFMTRVSLPISSLSFVMAAKKQPGPHVKGQSWLVLALCVTGCLPECISAKRYPLPHAARKKSTRWRT